ncbi:MAG: hypothetical protein HLX48_05645, partial [Halomonas sp.]|nr:hypothetical protein [Halomonas sp.]
RQEQRQLARVRLLWDFLREALEDNRAFLMGEAKEMVMPEAAPPTASAACQALPPS